MFRLMVIILKSILKKKPSIFTFQQMLPGIYAITCIGNDFRVIHAIGFSIIKTLKQEYFLSSFQPIVEVMMTLKIIIRDFRSRLTGNRILKCTNASQIHNEAEAAKTVSQR